MSIDIREFSGEYETPAAVEQQPSNSYVGNEHDFPVLLPEATEQTEAVEKPQEQEAPHEDPQERNFKALSESVERIRAEKEEQKREFQLQLDMLRANLVRGQQPDEPKARQMLDGMEDSDVPNVGEIRKAWEERESAYNQKIEELQVANAHPDYAEVLNKYGKHLAETDPLFVQGLRGAENKAQFAYQYAKREQRFQELEASMKQQQTPQNAPTSPSATAQRIVDNARKPGTLAQAGGQGALSKADYFATMSDQEFMKLASKHLESI